MLVDRHRLVELAFAFEVEGQVVQEVHHRLVARHLAERGERGVIFFFVGRADCHAFRPADEVDPTYGETLRRVTERGVEVLAYRMRFSARRLELVDRLPVDLRPL